MTYDLSAWHPGLVLALIAVLCVFTTAILISTLSVGLVQWRKVCAIKEMRGFVRDLTDQGYTAQEIEQLAVQFFEQHPKQSWQARCVKSAGRSE